MSVVQVAREGQAHNLPATLSNDASADHDLTLIIPAFNEENRLPWTLHELRRFLDQWRIDYRVVVADDGSSDSTAALTGGFGPRFSTAKLDRHRGKGAAVRNAMLQATGRVVGFTDADLPYELASLRQAYQRVQAGECEVVFGARDMDRSASHAPRRLARSLATWTFRAVVKRLVSRQVTDTQCGLKFFTRRAAREIFSRVTVEGFAFDAEVVFLTERLKLPFRRIPVNLIREYASTLSLSRDTLPMLWDIVKLCFRGRSLQLPSRPAAELAQQRQEDQRKAA